MDIQSGLINKVAVTPANVTDAKGLAHVLPTSGAVYTDKGYCVATAKVLLLAKEFIYVPLRKIIWKRRILLLTDIIVLLDIRLRGCFHKIISD
ncbi:MAG: hypothetical protein LN569_05770 [Rickettsia endosymbiont of Labidopullus appendiculatus]|nr:hypothetical protein [Rickettsia endosymbiont of Labidopullus appendiculatus]